MTCPRPPPRAIPPPPSAPPVPAHPTPRPHWPRRLRLLPPLGLTSCRRLLLRESPGPPGCTARRRAAPRSSAVPAPGGASELPGLLEDGCPESFLLALPLGAVLEEMFPSLGLVLAPPAGGVWAAGDQYQVLSGQAVARLQLVNRGARRLLARATVGPGFCFSQGRYLLFPVLASLLLTQPWPPSTSFPRSLASRWRGIAGAGTFSL